MKSLIHIQLLASPFCSFSEEITQKPQKKSRRNRRKNPKRTTTTTPAPRDQEIYDDEDFDGEDQDDIAEQTPLRPVRDQSPFQQVRDQDEGQIVQPQHIIAYTFPQQVADPSISQQNQNFPLYGQEPQGEGTQHPNLEPSDTMNSLRYQ